MRNIFDKKVAVITGAASGLGRALSYDLAKLGAKVVVADINIFDARIVATDIIEKKISDESNICSEYVDIVDLKSVESLFERVLHKFSNIDFFFSNAGVISTGEFRDTPLEEWYRLFDVNIKGALHCIYNAYKVMEKQGSGHIVSIGSSCGIAPPPCFGPYGASKSAMIIASTTLRLEAEKYNVKVSTVCPGVIETKVLTTIKTFGVNRKKLVDLMKTSVSPEKCSQIILRGVVKNKNIIPIGKDGLFSFWGYRYNRLYYEKVCRDFISSYRATAKESVVPIDISNKQKSWLIYGANGYGAKLIIEEAFKRGLRPILAGRNEEKISQLARRWNLQYLVFSLNDIDNVSSILKNYFLVLNCAGPFVSTAKILIQACLKSNTHYLDITGEIDVFEYAKKIDDEAKKAKVLITPGIGFDVVPSDCFAMYLKKNLPTANRLIIGIDTPRSYSAGTAKTIFNSLLKGGLVRQKGELVKVPMYHKIRKMKFSNKVSTVATVPYADLASSYHSTKIPNIEVYMRFSSVDNVVTKIVSKLSLFFSFPAIKWFIDKCIELFIRGPSEIERKSTFVDFYGEVIDENGNVFMATMVTANGYDVNTKISVDIVDHIFKLSDSRIESDSLCGYKTPAMLLGDDFVLHVPNVSINN